jgi:hypothetical protein
MKRYNAWMLATIGVCWGVYAASPAWAAEVELGATRAEVIDKLGEPAGVVMMRDIEVLFYSRGQVDLRDGEVVRSTILSEAEYEAEQQRLAEEAEARRKAAEEAAARRAEEGRQRLQEIQDEDTLAGRSASQRLAFWRGFQKQYPEVNVRSEIRAAEAEVQAQQHAAIVFEGRVQEELAKPPPGLSGSQLRKFRRGRSESAVAEREAEIREQLKQQMQANP